MKFSFVKKAASTLGIGLMTAVALISLTAGRAQAVQIPYEDVSTYDIKTPAFNTFMNVPNAVGNEADFVRVRPSTGDVADNGPRGERNILYVNGQAAVCNVGEKFDIRTYLHNGANDAYNNNGSGTAVAHDTKLRQVAPLNTTGKTFTFTSTISANNASPVSDTGRLYCEKNVMLRLVPSSVKVGTKAYGWQSAPDSAVNGDLPLGSRVAGSGDVWGCWDERVTVAYIVEVVEIPVVKIPAVCDGLEAIVLGSKKIRINQVRFTANDAVVNNMTITYGDGGQETVTPNQLPREHTYATAGKYNVQVTLNTTFKGQSQAVTSDNCKKTLDVTEEKVPFYACEAFKFNLVDRKATVTFTLTYGNGATFKDAKIVYSADSKEKNSVTVTQTSNNVVTNEYTFAATDKNVRADVTVHFNIGNEVKEVKCSGQGVLGVTTTPPTTLPKTGMEGIAGLFASVTTAGAVLHRKLTLRRK